MWWFSSAASADPGSHDRHMTGHVIIQSKLLNHMMSCEHKQLFWWDGHMMCHMTTMLSHMTTAHMYVHHWYINIVKELRVELD